MGDWSIYEWDKWDDGPIFPPMPDYKPNNPNDPKPSKIWDGDYPTKNNNDNMTRPEESPELGPHPPWNQNQHAWDYYKDYNIYFTIFPGFFWHLHQILSWQVEYEGNYPAWETFPPFASIVEEEYHTYQEIDRAGWHLTDIPGFWFQERWHGMQQGSYWYEQTGSHWWCRCEFFWQRYTGQTYYKRGPHLRFGDGVGVTGGGTVPLMGWLAVAGGGLAALAEASAAAAAMSRHRRGKRRSHETGIY